MTSIVSGTLLDPEFEHSRSTDSVAIEEIKRNDDTFDHTLQKTMIRKVVLSMLDDLLKDEKIDKICGIELDNTHLDVAKSIVELVKSQKKHVNFQGKCSDLVKLWVPNIAYKTFDKQRKESETNELIRDIVISIPAALEKLPLWLKDTQCLNFVFDDGMGSITEKSKFGISNFKGNLQTFLNNNVLAEKSLYCLTCTLSPFVLLKQDVKVAAQIQRDYVLRSVYEVMARSTCTYSILRFEERMYRSKSFPMLFLGIIFSHHKPTIEPYTDSFIDSSVSSSIDSYVSTGVFKPKKKNLRSVKRKRNEIQLINVTSPTLQRDMERQAKVICKKSNSSSSSPIYLVMYRNGEVHEKLEKHINTTLFSTFYYEKKRNKSE